MLLQHPVGPYRINPVDGSSQVITLSFIKKEIQFCVSFFFVFDFLKHQELDVHPTNTHVVPTALYIYSQFFAINMSLLRS